MAERSKEAIFLGATKNFQRSCKFLGLRTGQIITRKQFTSLPMPQYVIKKVDGMAFKENHKEDLLLTDQNGKT